ncbi:MAG: hypothetical protein SGI74_00260 [Oligoflexia bacterium]|nr:hypothetical protein [Oligoflexia bacterium]
MKSFLLLMVVLTVACFKNPGEEKTPVLAESVPIAPYYNLFSKSALTNESWLWAEGKCFGNKTIIFTYESPLTPKNSIDAICAKNGMVALKLPVVEGHKPQMFKVEMYARLGAKKSKTLMVNVNYFPTPPAVPGYAVLTGGGRVSHATANVSMTTQIGESWTYTTVPTAAGVKLAPGLDGVVGSFPY